MRKRPFSIAIAISLGLLLTGLVGSYGRADAPNLEIGSIRSFFSENGQYSIDIKTLGYPDTSPSECTFKEKNRIIWSKRIPTTPGKVNISNDGKYIVMANWGWYDEGGFKSLSLYNNKGKLIRELNFNKPGSFLLWIRSTAISPDGMYYVFSASSTAVKAKIYLYEFYEFGSGNLVWANEYECWDVVEIEISDEGRSILVAAQLDYNSGDMLFFLLNRKGDIIWEKKIEKNFSWDIKDYLHLDSSGGNFEIFDKANAKYISFVNSNGRVSSVSRYQEQPLLLTIKSNKKVYKFGEKINIEASIKNIGKDTAKIYSPAFWDVGEMIIRDSDGDMMKPQGMKIKHTFEDFMTIPPGESSTYIFENLTWFFYGGAWQFKLSPDIYTIYVTVTNPPTRVGAKYLQTSLYGTITSNTITIEVLDDEDVVSKKEALKIAEDVCKKEKWERFWHGIKVEDEDSYWKVWTPFRLGGNILIRIDKKTGKVIEKYLTGP